MRRRSIRKIKKNSLPANSSSSVLTLRLPSIAFLRAVKRGGREKENRFRDFEGCVYVHIFCAASWQKMRRAIIAAKHEKRGNPPQQEENQNEMFIVLHASCMAYFFSCLSPMRVGRMQRVFGLCRPNHEDRTNLPPLNAIAAQYCHKPINLPSMIRFRSFSVVRSSAKTRSSAKAAPINIISRAWMVMQ